MSIYSFKNKLLVSVKKYLSCLLDDEPRVCVAWVTPAGRINVTSKWKNWQDRFEGLTAYTNCNKESRPEIVASHLLRGLNDTA